MRLVDKGRWQWLPRIQPGGLMHRGTKIGVASLGKMLVSPDYFEFEVALKHSKPTRSSEEGVELKMDFGVIIV